MRKKPPTPRPRTKPAQAIAALKTAAKIRQKEEEPRARLFIQK